MNVIISSLQRIVALSILLTLVTLAIAGPPPSAVWTYPNYSGAQISWNMVPGATGYLVYRGTTSTNEKLIGTTSGTTYNDNSLTNGEAYYYYVKAQFASTASSASMVASVTPGATPLSAPLGTAQPAKGAVKVYWTRNPSATFYLIERYDPVLGWNVVEIASGSATVSYNDTNVTNGCPYTYQIQPGNASGTGKTSNTFGAVAGDTPATGPVGIWAIPQQGSVYLAWNQVPAASAYVIYKSTASGGEGSSPYAILNGSGSNTFTDNVANGVTAYYQVAPIDFSGTGTQSPEAFACSNAPTIPAPVSATRTSGNSIQLDWSVLSDVDDYVIYRSVGNANNFVLYGSVVDATTFNDTAVVNGTYYYYAVAGKNAYGTGLTGGGVNLTAQTEAKAGSGDPPATTGIAAQANGSTINIYWNPVPGAVAYNIYRGGGPGEESLYATYDGSLNFQDNHVDLFTLNFYVVRAVSATGAEGLGSVEVSAAGGAPRLAEPEVAAYVQGSAATIVAGMVPDALYYNIYRTTNTNGQGGYVQIASNVRAASGATWVSCTDSSTVPYVTYYYQVAAVNLDGEGLLSSSVAVTPGDAPLSAPAGSLAYSKGQNSIYIQCDFQVGALSYNLYRSTTTTMPLAPYATGLGTPQFNDYYARTGVVYYYAFASADADGQSALSPLCSAAAGTPALPAPILTLNQASSSLTLSWSPVTGASGYDVYRASDSNQDYIMVSENQPGATYLDMAVTPGIEYYYWVVPVAVTGAGSRSNTVTGIPGSTPLPAPLGLAATAGGSNVNLSFNPVFGAASYNVYMATASGQEGAVPVAVGVGTNPGIGNLQSKTMYYFEVTAVDADGQSLVSEEVSALTGSSALPAPTLSLAVAGATLKLTWTSVSQAASYNVYRKISGGNWLFYQNVSKLSYVDTSITQGATYYYLVAAVNSAGQGNGSNTVSGND